jgi:hypothetical protein
VGQFSKAVATVSRLSRAYYSVFFTGAHTQVLFFVRTCAWIPSKRVVTKIAKKLSSADLANDAAAL